ncbi:MAG: NADH-quinone oxidoreductase subunit J [Candidatus Micrarchaeaceae archaeon]
MLDAVLFALISALAVISAIMIFVSRKLLYAIIYLSLVFVSSAFLFMLLGQPLLGLLQLLVFVGGISAYLITVVAAEYKKSEMASLPKLLAVAFAMGILMYIFLLQLPALSIQANSFTNEFSSDFSSMYLILFFVVAMLFGTAIGSILVIKRIIRLVV